MPSGLTGEKMRAYLEVRDPEGRAEEFVRDLVDRGAESRLLRAMPPDPGGGFEMTCRFFPGLSR